MTLTSRFPLLGLAAGAALAVGCAETDPEDLAEERAEERAEQIEEQNETEPLDAGIDGIDVDVEDPSLPGPAVDIDTVPDRDTVPDPDPGPDVVMDDHEVVDAPGNPEPDNEGIDVDVEDPASPGPSIDIDPNQDNNTVPEGT